MEKALNIDYRSIMTVAFPLIIGNFIQSLVLITDMAFLSHLGELEYDAVGNAGLIYITFFMIALGFGDAMQIVMARFIGNSQVNAVSKTFQSGLLSMMILATIFFVVLQFVIPNWLANYAHNPDIGRLQNEFLSVRSYSIFISLMAYALMAFLLAVGKTKIVFITSIVMSLVNIFGDYVLIFGEWGFPKLGVEGAALASMFADISTLVILAIYFTKSKWIKDYQLFQKMNLEWNSAKQLFKVAWPLMLQGFIALGTWTFFFMWIEQKGSRDLEISQNIRVMYFLAFIPIFGFAATTKTYISQLLGAKNYTAIPIVQRRILFLVIATLLLFFHGGLLYPETLLSVVNPRTDVNAESARILQQVFPAILVFAFTSVFFNTISGSGNTKVTLLIETLCVALYLISAYVFIFVFHWSIDKVWYVEYIYFSTLALGSLIYLKFFDWKKTANVI
jgi:multidrug resistance protein, MATE family